MMSPRQRKPPGNPLYEGQGIAMSGKQLYSLFYEKIEREGTICEHWEELSVSDTRAWEALALEVVLRIP